MRTEWKRNKMNHNRCGRCQVMANYSNLPQQAARIPSQTNPKYTHTSDICVCMRTSKWNVSTIISLLLQTSLFKKQPNWICWMSEHFIKLAFDTSFSSFNFYVTLGSFSLHDVGFIHTHAPALHPHRTVPTPSFVYHIFYAVVIVCIHSHACCLYDTVMERCLQTPRNPVCIVHLFCSVACMKWDGLFLSLSLPLKQQRCKKEEEQKKTTYIQEEEWMSAEQKKTPAATLL